MKQYIKPLLKTIGIIALIELINIIILIVYLITSGIQDIESVSGDLIVGVSVVSQIAVFLLILLRYRKKQFVSLVRLNKTSPKILLWAFLIGIGSLSFSRTLIAIMQVLIPSQVAAYADMMSEVLSGSNVLMTLLAVVILAPLTEEIVMRGLLFRWFENTNMKPWALIWVSGLFFGLWHMNIVQGIFATVIGIVCALCFMMTKSLWVPIVIHFSNNAFAMGIICIKRELTKSPLIGQL